MSAVSPQSYESSPSRCRSPVRPNDAELRLRAAQIRRCVIEMCRRPGQGYAGQGLELADLMAVLFHDEMRVRPDGSLIDRFILSTGHSAIALYSALWSIGMYDLELLRTYGLDGSEIEESPLDDLKGFEVTGGSLGQGPSQAVGIALGERMRGTDTRVYCEVSDGELQEGGVWEAFMLAADRQLSNLVFLVDENGEQADGRTAEVLSLGDVTQKLDAFGVAARSVDGHDIAEIRDALEWSRGCDGPSAIVLRTSPGHGAPVLEQFERVHYVRAKAVVWEAAADGLDSQINKMMGDIDAA